MYASHHNEFGCVFQGLGKDSDPQRFSYHETPMDGETLTNSISKRIVVVPGSKEQQDIKRTERKGKFKVNGTYLTRDAPSTKVPLSVSSDKRCNTGI